MGIIILNIRVTTERTYLKKLLRGAYVPVISAGLCYRSGLQLLVTKRLVIAQNTIWHDIAKLDVLYVHSAEASRLLIHEVHTAAHMMFTVSKPNAFYKEICKALNVYFI